MRWLSKITAKVGWKGPKWVKPSFEEWLEEMRNEDEIVFQALKDVGALPTIYNKSYVKEFTPAQAKSIDITEGDCPPLEWLTNPNLDKHPQDNYDPNSYGIRYIHRHQKDVLPAMRDGKPLTMPILQHINNEFMAQAGRHRICYAITLDIPLQAFVTDWKDIVAANPKGLK